MAATMTLAEIRESVRTQLGDDEYDADVIDEAANWMQYQLFNDHRLRIAEETDTISVSTGDSSADFPDDMMTLIYLGNGSASILNDEIDYNLFMQDNPNWSSADSAVMGSWTRYGNGIRFATPLSQAYTMPIDYLREPTLMEADDDECEIPARYKEMFVKGTTIRVKEIDEDYDVAQADRDNLAPMITTFVRNEGRGGGKVGPTVMRTNRGRAGGYRADRDF
jgi:hypothetical protein